MELTDLPAPSPAPIDPGLLARFGVAELRDLQREAIDASSRARPRARRRARRAAASRSPTSSRRRARRARRSSLSPLVALMEDQVRALSARGIPATFLASTLDPEERRRARRRWSAGEYKLVYAAPERLASDAFVEPLARCELSLVAVDEAHCIAQWGHDFRPDYLRIGALLERLRPPRVLACTATATPDGARARSASAARARRATAREVLRGFARPEPAPRRRSTSTGRSEARARRVSKTLAARARRAAAPTRRRHRLRGHAAARPSSGRDGSARARLDARRLPRGHRAPRRERASPTRFAARALDVVVATNAFGMGIDRADIRAVVHVQPPVVDRGVLPGGRARGARRRRGRGAAPLLGRGHRAPAPARRERRGRRATPTRRSPRARGSSSASSSVTSTRARAATTSSSATSATSTSSSAAAATATSASNIAARGEADPRRARGGSAQSGARSRGWRGRRARRGSRRSRRCSRESAARAWSARGSISCPPWAARREGRRLRDGRAPRAVRERVGGFLRRRRLPGAQDHQTGGRVMRAEVEVHVRLPAPRPRRARGERREAGPKARRSPVDEGVEKGMDQALFKALRSHRADASRGRRSCRPT